MAVESVFMTASGIQKLLQQQNNLRVRLQQALEVLQDGTRTAGEDATAMALAEKDYVEERLRLLDDRLQRVRPLETSHHDEVGLGSTVELETKEGTRKFTLVDTLEADPAANYISPESPLGSSLMGHQVGESVEVNIPMGRTRFLIRSIQYAL